MSARIAIINYGMGNLRSVENALLKVGADPKIVTQPSDVTDVEGLVLPGVGALEDCVDGLRASKFDDFIAGWIQEDRPFMGVCLGLQALFDVSEERNVKGLGIFPGKVIRFVSKPGFKIPIWAGIPPSSNKMILATGKIWIARMTAFTLFTAITQYQRILNWY